MAQDLRKLFEEDRKRGYALESGHEKRFENRLHQSFPLQPKKRGNWWWIAASVVIMLAVGVYGYRHSTGGMKEAKVPVQTGGNIIAQKESISLGDLSPDLKQVEDYYVVSINLALSELEVSGDTKALADDYMKRLEELNKEYIDLNTELNKIGPNDQTITVLIKNLQLRLQLLQKLKVKLKEFKSNQNEEDSSISI
jgi:hypothetical protein